MRFSPLHCLCASALVVSFLHGTPAGAQGMPQDNSASWASARLAQSPRHHEYVKVQQGPRTLQLFVVYPQVRAKAPAVVMIHEIFGLSLWAREMADELASKGYIVVEPDLLSGMGPHGGSSDSFPDQEARVKAVSMLDEAQVTADLNAAADYAKKLPAANGELAVAGFCWGGGQSFQFATVRPDLKAVFVFYGPPPPDASLPHIVAPVYGFYAGEDARISATVPATEAAMKAAGKRYAAVVYPGAGHGFMPAGEAPDAGPANKAARGAGFSRMVALLQTSTR